MDRRTQMGIKILKTHQSHVRLWIGLEIDVFLGF